MNFRGGDLPDIFIAFERIISISDNSFIAGRFGLGSLFIWYIGFGGSKPTEFYTLTTQGLSYNFGKDKHFAEAGFGNNIIFGYPQAKSIQYIHLGYRLHPRMEGKTNFRIFLNFPLSKLDEESDKKITGGIGISIGKSF